ncbi:mobilization protein [Faecalibacterium sp. An77]|uniref:plasmid mobilization protein n=1 Tax=Faecalibacterium sp. An77 TaxID=1965655 RepID=UPI000B38DB0D|nr:plasmid mobilization relaxosome protein MobC [Faecalibacterium sp. An77]OUN40044.1 mobilization protein [Faecalibacterium sp. An77]
MTKTKNCPKQNTIQKDGPPRKTQFIKFRVTPEEKRELEIMCEILHVNISTLIRRSLHSQSIKQTIVVTGGGEDALSILSDLLGQCGRIGSNLNQLARHFNSGGKDSEQIRAQLLTELSALTLFRLDAEKKMGELYGNHQAYKLEELRSYGT